MEWDSGGNKHTTTGDWTTTTNSLNQQQDSTTDTNSTKWIWDEIAKAKKVLGQWTFFCRFSWTLSIWHKTNPRGKQRVIPHGKPEIWYHLMRIRPDLPRGRDKFDWWRTRRWWSDFKLAWFKSCNRYTTAPLVINQAQLDWPRREAFPASESKDTSKKM